MLLRCRRALALLRRSQDAKASWVTKLREQDRLSTVVFLGVRLALESPPDRRPCGLPKCRVLGGHARLTRCRYTTR